MRGTSPRAVKLVLVVLAGALAMLVAPSASASAASETGVVYVVHGLDGETLDLYVDETNVCPTAPTKAIVGPITLAVGEHTVSLRRGTEIVTQARFTVTAGTSTDLVAHRTAMAGAEPVVTVFPNDVSAVAPGKARLVVSHTAAAPPADITLDGDPLVRNVANGESFATIVPARTYSLALAPTATSGQPVLGPISLAVKAGTLTRVYAIGVAGTSMDAVVHEIPVTVTGAAAPSSVPTGDGGQAAAGLLDDPSALGALGAGAVAVALVAVAGFGRRSRRLPAGRLAP